VQGSRPGSAQPAPEQQQWQQQQQEDAPAPPQGPARVLRFDAGSGRKPQRAAAPPAAAAPLPPPAAAPKVPPRQQELTSSARPAAQQQPGRAPAAARGSRSTGVSLRSSRAHVAPAAAAVTGGSPSADPALLRSIAADPDAHVQRVAEEVRAARRAAAQATGLEPGSAAAVPALNSSLRLVGQMEELQVGGGLGPRCSPALLHVRFPPLQLQHRRPPC
jgi:hypothetical protein